MTPRTASRSSVSPARAAGRVRTASGGGWRSRLWPSQSAAISLIERYLAERPQPKGSALVRMPTGTGKSGVIAVAAHDVAPAGHVLILAPWDALVRQLLADVQARFWNRIKVVPPSKREAVRLLPSNAADELADAKHEDRIFVATIATLKELQRERPAEYGSLARSVSLVLVDEGHYEPAPNWSQAVRGLGKPVVLLTATPYRNDLKFFRVDERFIYSYSHDQAEKDRYIRPVRFHEERWISAATFARQLIAFTAATFTDGQPRIIVRCSFDETVRQVARALRARGASVIGIHERFGSDDPLFTSRVPDPDLPGGPQYWVHQFKLIEGIDNPDFRVLAIYEPLGNERSFVQQVGRILRNPTRSSTESGWVFCDPDDQLTRTWTAYRDFDRDERSRTYRSPAEVARSQPLQYNDRRFRSPFDLDAKDVAFDFDYPLATQVFAFERARSLDELTEDIRAQWEQFDLSLGLGHAPDTSTRVIPYIVQRNSPLLLRKAFTEFELGVTIFRRVRGYLFYYDAHGFTPDALTAMPRVDPTALTRLYQGALARLTSVSLRNTSLGRFDVRRRSLQAHSIDELAPDLADQAHFASTATGFTQPKTGALIGRYIGFGRARVRDRRALPTPFADYATWIDTLADELDAGRDAPAVFDRYAQLVPTPADPRPANILLDFGLERFRQAPHKAKRPALLDVADLCLPVAPNGEFTCEANGTPYVVNVNWQQSTGTYHLESTALDSAYVNTSKEPRAPGLLAFLNRTQTFRIVPRSATYTVYSRGRFYRPRVPLLGTQAADRFALLRILQPLPELAAIGSEKGDDNALAATPARWANGTLFNFIDRLGAGGPLEADLASTAVLVCDDMGTEIADFLALDTQRKRVIAFHAKAFPAAKNLSAGALHEVTAQALKNLGYLQPYFVGTPKNLARWDGGWNGGKIGTVQRRIRKGNVTGAQAWARIRDALRDPDYTREVWLVLGRGLSRTALEQARAAASPPPEAIQIVYSLQSIWSSVSAVGARLRVLCSP